MKRRAQIAGSIFFVAAVGCIGLSTVRCAAQTAPAAQKFSASAIQIEQSDPPADLVIPENFRVSTYERVIQQLTKTGKFQQVYRIGDTRAKDVPDLVTLRLIPSAYKKGSQKQREVTTVTGATSLKVKVTVTNRDGKVLVDREVEGKVRFLGENLRATYDLSKKVAAIIRESF